MSYLFKSDFCHGMMKPKTMTVMINRGMLKPKMIRSLRM